MSLLFIGFDQRSMLRLSFHKTTSKYIEHGTLKQLTPLFLIVFDETYGNIMKHIKEEILYLFVRDLPKDNKIVLKGIANKINRNKIFNFSKEAI